MEPRTTPRPVIVVDGDETAAALVAGGADVVVVVPEGGAPLHRPPGPGRLAVMVGDVEDGDVRAAAEAMGAEVFGA